MAHTLGTLLRACRNSANLSQKDLAACVHRKSHFPASSNIDKDWLLTEIENIEQTGRCRLSGDKLRTFWRKALECLRSADPVALALLGVQLARDLPDP
jgi:hypothetical protein